MKVTQEMVDAFSETLERVPHKEIAEGIQAVLDLINPQERRTVYRSLTPDGKVWCESSDPGDFPNEDPLKALTYQKLTEYAVDSGWQEWTP